MHRLLSTYGTNLSAILHTLYVEFFSKHIFHLECEEYNRSMLIFDIDSLIMLSVSDSQMSKSLSISNIRLYQFIRQKCKTSIVEQRSTTSNAVS
jgi:hypothetical protein